MSDPLPIIDEETGLPVISYFVVSFVPEPLATQLAHLGDSLPHGFESQSPERMHITWRSFDGLPSGQLEALKDALRSVCQGAEPFSVHMTGGGAFDVGAVWAAIEPTAAVTELQRRIDAALSVLGLPEATHEFIPHVTIGRGPEGTKPPEFLDTFEAAFDVDEILLTTTGNQAYRVVVRTPLGEGIDD